MHGGVVILPCWPSWPPTCVQAEYCHRLRPNMMPKKKLTANQPHPPLPSTSTAQQLGSLIKSARDIMRKDKGLNGDLDRLPMLTWIMFLKFLDDLEQIREEEAKLAA